MKIKAEWRSTLLSTKSDRIGCGASDAGVTVVSSLVYEWPLPKHTEGGSDVWARQQRQYIAGPTPQASSKPQVMARWRLEPMYAYAPQRIEQIMVKK